MNNEIIIPAATPNFKVKKMGCNKVLKSSNKPNGEPMPRQYYDLFYKNQWAALYPGEKINLETQRLANTLIEMSDWKDVLFVSDTHIGKDGSDFFQESTEIANKINSRLLYHNQILILLGDIIDIDDRELNRDVFEIFLDKIAMDRDHIILILGNNDILRINDYIDMGLCAVLTEIKTHNILISHFPSNDVSRVNIHGHNHAWGQYLRYPNRNHVDASYTEVNPIGANSIFSLEELMCGVDTFDRMSVSVDMLNNVQYIYTLD